MIRFWERRVRRIMPALLVVVAAVMVAGWLFLMPRAYSDLGRSAVCQILLTSNVYFWRTTNYFAQASEEKPLLHTWSLAVEEQFYLVLPLLLMGLSWLYWKFRSTSRRSSDGRIELVRAESDARGTEGGASGGGDLSIDRGVTGRWRWVLLVVFGGLYLVSVALSIWGVHHQPYATFFLLPTRAWELMCGAFLAILPSSFCPEKPSMKEVVSLLGLSGVLLPVLLYGERTLFPGMAALPPCLGTTLLIWANTDSRRPTVTARILSLGPVVFVGLISYSFYLIHWPIFAYFRYWQLEAMSTAAQWVLIGLAFMLAVITYYLVEKPFRQRRLLKTRRSLFTGAILGSLILFSFASYVILKDGVTGRFSAVAEAYDRTLEEEEFTQSFSTEDVVHDRLFRLGVERENVDVLVWGDSFAMALLPVIDDALRENGLSGRAATHSATAPLVNFYRVHPYGLGKDAKEWGDEVIKFCKRRKVKLVILAANWEAHINQPGADEEGVFEDQMLTTIQTIEGIGARALIFLGVPGYTANVPKILAHATVFGSDPKPFWQQAKRKSRFSDNPTILRKMQDAGATVVDPRSEFYDSNIDGYPGVQNDRALYRDSGHLTPYGARLRLKPLFQKILKTEISG